MHNDHVVVRAEGKKGIHLPQIIRIPYIIQRMCCNFNRDDDVSRVQANFCPPSQLVVEGGTPIKPVDIYIYILYILYIYYIGRWAHFNVKLHFLLFGFNCGQI